MSRVHTGRWAGLLMFVAATVFTVAAATQTVSAAPRKCQQECDARLAACQAVCETSGLCQQCWDDYGYCSYNAMTCTYSYTCQAWEESGVINYSCQPA